MATEQQLQKLQECIDAFLVLHNNPFDTSSMQDKAVKIEKIAAVLQRQTDEPPAPLLQGSVGIGQENHAADVKLVKTRLNACNGLHKLKQDTIDVGMKTDATIRNFQQRIGEPEDGIVAPRSATLKALLKDSQQETVSVPTQDTTTEEHTTAGETPTSPSHDTTVEEAAVSTSTSSTISNTVGLGGVNEAEDVKLVKALLNKKMNTNLDENNGEAGDDLVTTIKQLQENHGIRQSGLIKPQSDSWNALIMSSKGFSTDMYDTAPENHTIGGAETAVERELAEFAMFFEGIPIDVDGGTVFVRPPYHIHSDASEERKMEYGNSASEMDDIKSILNAAIGSDRLNQSNGRAGKATPPQIQRFLQTCVDKGYVKGNTAEEMRNFLDHYQVSSDCSGLAVQAANFLLEDGDLERPSLDLGEGEAIRTMGTADIYNQTEVSSPADLRASDMMVVPTQGEKTGHVRVLIDVDMEGNAVLFTTLESTANSAVSDEGDGVGQRRWKFPDKSRKEGLQNQVNGQWVEASDADKAYKYVHFTQLETKRTEDEQT